MHGAWHGTWCWERVIAELDRRGHKATAVALPTNGGTQTYVSAIDAAISSPADTTLVAHSGSGVFAPIVAGRRGVRELVLLAALMPLPGNSWMAQRKALKSAQHTDSYLRLESRISIDAHGSTTWPTQDAAELFYHDSEPADAADAAQRLRKQDITTFTETAPPVVKVPTRYIVCTQDRAINRDWAVPTARERFDATIEEIDASHSPFWSRPAELAELLITTTSGSRQAVR